MTDQSAAELERDAEAARAKVADTAEFIRNKMSPGQLIDEFTGMFAGGDGSAALANLKSQIRDNPLPLTLVGAGLAWLMLGSGSSGSSSAHRQQHMSVDRSNRYTSGGATAEEDARSGRFGDLADSVREKVEGAAASASDMTGEAVQGAKDAADSVRQGLANKSADLANTARNVSESGRQMMQDLVQREPLVIAAVGVALGAAIGALLPSTAIEDEQLGSLRDSVRGKASKLVHAGVEEVKDVAAETYETVKAEADNVSLEQDDGSTVTERVGEALKSTVAKTEDTVRNRLKKAKTSRTAKDDG